MIRIISQSPEWNSDEVGTRIQNKPQPVLEWDAPHHDSREGMGCFQKTCLHVLTLTCIFAEEAHFLFLVEPTITFLLNCNYTSHNCPPKVPFWIQSSDTPITFKNQRTSYFSPVYLRDPVLSRTLSIPKLAFP